MTPLASVIEFGGGNSYFFRSIVDALPVERYEVVDAEQIGVWKFPDERPLLPNEIVAAGEGLGMLRHSATLWPLVLTQQAVVWQSR